MGITTEEEGSPLRDCSFEYRLTAKLRPACALKSTERVLRRNFEQKQTKLEQIAENADESIRVPAGLSAAGDIGGGTVFYAADTGRRRRSAGTGAHAPYTGGADICECMDYGSGRRGAFDFPGRCVGALSLGDI